MSVIPSFVSRSHICVLVTVLITAILIQQNFALQCYDCNSFIDSECEGNETQLARFKKECKPEQNFAICRKIVQTIEDPKVTNAKRVIRTCGWVNSTYNDKCYHRSGLGGSQEVCSCLGDLCNASQSPTVTYLTALLTVTVMLLSNCFLK